MWTTGAGPAAGNSVTSQASGFRAANTLFRKAAKVVRSVRQTNWPRRRFTRRERSSPRRVAAARLSCRISPSGPQREVAHRREVVKVGVALQGGLEFGLGRKQFLVLHLQFGLVYFQLMLQASQIGSRWWRVGGTPLYTGLGGAPQTGGITGWVGFHVLILQLLSVSPVFYPL